MHFTDLNSLVIFFGSLAGVGAFISCLVNIGKTVGLVKDGQAQTYVVGLNLLGLVVLFVIGIVKPDANIQGLDAQAGTLASLLMVVFGFVWQLISSKLTHDKVLKGTPLIGTSFTIQAELAKAKAFHTIIEQRPNV